MRAAEYGSIAACNIEQNFSPEVQAALDISVQEIGLSEPIANVLHMKGLCVVRDVMAVDRGYMERLISMDEQRVNEVARAVKQLGVPFELRRISSGSHLAHFCGSLATIGATAFVGRVVNTDRLLTVHELGRWEAQSTFTAVDVLERRLPRENARNFGWFYPRYNNVEEFYAAHMDDFRMIATQFNKEHERLLRAGRLPASYMSEQT
ncbi:MAG TPA: hypothetical protein VLG16_03090 [Candidatus Saccharimonadales bacterium]|nr:hypothetical protein [Candidatus Saccharimonadales bacterium]